MSNHNELGKLGESLSCKYLSEHGYEILATNFRFQHKEIDVIALVKDVLVFIEIKTRSNFDFGFPEEAVNPRKQALLKQAAERYCLDNPQYTKIRFDVMSLLIQNGILKEIKHFEDAFY